MGKAKTKLEGHQEIKGPGPGGKASLYCVTAGPEQVSSKWAEHSQEIEYRVPAAKLSGPKECPGVPQTAVQTFATALKG